MPATGRRVPPTHWLIALVFALGVLFVFKDYGIGWDDPFQSKYGDLLIAHYESGRTDFAFEEFHDLRYYGGAFEIPAQLLVRVSPFTANETRRLLGGLVGALGVAGCGALGFLLAGRAGAAMSSALLALWPTWLGHSLVNSKDAPFAVAYVWALVFLIRIARGGSGPRSIDQLGFALSAGAALGVRAGGLILFAAHGLLLARCVVWNAMGPRTGGGARVASSIGGFLVAAAVGWGLMLVAWPWAQAEPFQRPFEAAQIMSRFPRPMEVLFDGVMMTTRRLPWSYAPTWLAITLPPLVAVLVAAFPVVFARTLYADRRAPAMAAWILFLCTAVPLLLVVNGRVVLYDGVRQILFVVPALVAMAARGLLDVWRALESRAARRVVALVAAILCLDPLSAFARLHPYEYIYFNRFVGGLRGASGRFETDYWALALRETAEWLSANRGLLRTERAIKAHVPHNCGEPISAGAYLDPAIVLTDNDLAATVFLAPARFRCHERGDGTIVFRAQREGVTLAVVKVMD